VKAEAMPFSQACQLAGGARVAEGSIVRGLEGRVDRPSAGAESKTGAGQSAQTMTVDELTERTCDSGERRAARR